MSAGSVAAYAKFLLLFLYSLQDVLPKVRSFAFPATWVRSAVTLMNTRWRKGH